MNEVACCSHGIALPGKHCSFNGFRRQPAFSNFIHLTEYHGKNCQWKTKDVEESQSNERHLRCQDVVVRINSDEDGEGEHSYLEWEEFMHLT